MTALCGPTFVGDDCNQLVVAGVKALTVRPVQDFVVLLVLLCFLSQLGSLSDEPLLLLLFLRLLLLILFLELLVALFSCLQFALKA